MKHLGQHFLRNQATIEKAIRAIDVQPGETIIEIGPGHGELTMPLAEICKKIGANIIALEKDQKLAERLTEDFAQNMQVKIIPGDALKLLKEGFKQRLAAASAATKIVGNIPYYITGHLLRIVSEMEEKPERCVFMIQKEVAERICAVAPKMNRLAASVQVWAKPKIIAHVPKGDFSPVPEVDSAVIQLDTTQPPNAPKNAERYYTAVRTLFAQPRKTILNNLAKENKEKVIEILAALGIDPQARPQNLTIKQITGVADRLFLSVHK